MNYNLSHTTCYLFPGQGILEPADILSYKDDHTFQKRYSEVNNILYEDVLASYFNGKISINDTLLNSIIVVLHSILSYEKYIAENHEDIIKCLAGFSIGQFTALYISGVLSFEQLILMLSYRSKLIENSLSLKDTGMLYVIGIKESLLSELINDIYAQFPSCFIGITNFNAPGNYTVSGHNSCLQLLSTRLSEVGVKLCGRVSISGARHCPLLKTEIEAFSNFMSDSISFSASQISIISNCTAQYLSDDPTEIKNDLLNHLVMPVLWYQSIQTAILEGCSKFIEFGNNEMLSKFNFFIDRKKISISYNYRS